MSDAARRGLPSFTDLVDLPMLVLGEVADVVHPHVDQPVLDRSAEQALAQGSLDHAGEDRQDVDAHVARLARQVRREMTERPTSAAVVPTSAAVVPTSAESRRSATGGAVGALPRADATEISIGSGWPRCGKREACGSRRHRTGR